MREHQARLFLKELTFLKELHPPPLLPPPRPRKKASRWPFVDVLMFATVVLLVILYGMICDVFFFDALTVWVG